MSGLDVRIGGPDDAAAVLSLWDSAIAWLAARGQLGQWGAEPASARPRCVEAVRGWAAADGLRIAERDGRAVGASVIARACPAHVVPTARPETYVWFLVTDRARAGEGIGAALIRRAVADARSVGSALLRVDCWAGAPSLVSWYERQGFSRSATFEVNGGWRGQVFEMEL